MTTKAKKGPSSRAKAIQAREQPGKAPKPRKGNGEASPGKRGPKPNVANIPRDREIVRRATEGETLADIARDYSISRERVRQIAKEGGVTPRRVINRAAVEAAADLVVAGARVDAVAGPLASISSIRYELERRGFNLRERQHAEFLARSESRVRGEGTVVCRRCGEEKPWSEMRMGKRNGVDSRQALCHPCNSEAVLEWGRANRGRTPEPTVTEKECTGCKMVKPANQFHRNTLHRTGLQAWCKLCHASL